MEKNEIKYLLERYFEGETTETEESVLENYFLSGNVDAEFAHYAGYFGGLANMAGQGADVKDIESEVMDFILENEGREKTKYRWLWQTVTGIAATVILVLGGILLFEQNQKPFKDSFDDPDKAYVFAAQTLRYVSGKYNKGTGELAYFGKLRQAAEPLEKATAPVNKVMEKLKGDGSQKTEDRSRESEVKR